jgi:3-oxoacyl-[acyl-carrier protein] reductase
MDLHLKNKVALVTAASKGLGYATALILAEEGAKVVICSRNSESIATAADNIRKATGAVVQPIVADLAKSGDITALVEKVVDGLGAIDVALLNTGGPKPGNFLDLTPEDWDIAIQTTLTSVVNLAYAIIPVMRKQGQGSLLVNTSVTVKEPLDNLVLSNSLRMAVIGLVKSLSNEVGPDNIRVNAIAPGWTRTERVDQLLKVRMESSGCTIEEEIAGITANIPLRRIASPAEYSKTAAFLLSPAASYITGVTILVDGGMSSTAL